MKTSIKDIVNLFKEHGPFERDVIFNGTLINRISAKDPRLVKLTIWGLSRDGNTCPEGTDILSCQVTEYGIPVLYVNIKKPDTDALSDNQYYYRIEL